MKGLINLIRAVKQTYAFIHPLDQRGSTISKREFQTIEYAQQYLLKKLNGEGRINK